MKVNTITEKRALIVAIGLIATSGAALDEQIHTAAVSCLYHAKNHGDVTLASRLVDAMPKSTRRLALIHWFNKYGPLVFDKPTNAFKLARGKEPRPYEIEKAEETPFWDLTTEKNPAKFSVESLLKSVATRFKKAKEKGELADGDLAKFQQQVASLSV